MQASDRSTFEEMIAAVLGSHGKPVNPGILRLWWAALKDYPYEQIDRAMLAHCKDPKEGRFCPVPAHLIAKMPTKPGDWPSSEVAYKLTPKSEHEAAYVVRQMLGAWEVAEHAGNETQRRIQYCRVYDELVTAAQAAGEKPQWFFSRADNNPAANLAAVEDARERGIITHEFASRMIENMGGGQSGGRAVTRWSDQ